MSPDLIPKRIAKMHAAYGPGPKNQSCEGCVSLALASTKTRVRLVCVAAGGVEWKLSNPSCAAWRQAGEYHKV